MVEIKCAIIGVGCGTMGLSTTIGALTLGGI